MGALALLACGSDVGVVPVGASTTSGTDGVASTSTRGGDELGMSEDVSGHVGDTDTTYAPDASDGGASTSGGDTGSTGDDTGTSTGEPPSWCEDVDCDDGDPCTDDTCDEIRLTCVHALAAGNPCDDGDGCTVGDTCQTDGACPSGDDICLAEHCGTTSSDEIWGPDVVHVLTCPVLVEGPTEPTLAILDGTTVLAEA